jgi:large subunit GTPase 1
MQVCHFLIIVARGFAKSVQGNPDEARASRYILKDYVQGKLLYVEPPTGKDGTLFNQSIYEDETLISRQLKKIQIRKVQEQVVFVLLI